MNKKILVILSLLIVVTSITAVSAFDLGDLFGSDENKTVTIGGLDFNVPAGFEESNSNVTHDSADSLKKEGYNVTEKIYANESSAIFIFVANATASGKVIDNDALKEGANATKVNNVDGYMQSWW